MRSITFEMVEKTLEQRILSTLLRQGKLNASQLAVYMSYALSASDELDNNFFGALQSLERRRLVHWKPASSEILGIDDSNCYIGKLYALGSGRPMLQVMKDAYHAVIDKIKQYF